MPSLMILQCHHSNISGSSCWSYHPTSLLLIFTSLPIHVLAHWHIGVPIISADRAFCCSASQLCHYHFFIWSIPIRKCISSFFPLVVFTVISIVTHTFLLRYHLFIYLDHPTVINHFLCQLFVEKHETRNLFCVEVYSFMDWMDRFQLRAGRWTLKKSCPVDLRFEDCNTRDQNRCLWKVWIMWDRFQT